MAKESFQDIVPSPRRSIRQIEVSPSRGVSRKDPPLGGGSGLPPMPSSPPPPRFSGARRGFGPWILAGLVVVAFGFGLSLFFSHTSVKVVPKQSLVAVDGVYQAFKAPPAGGLSYQVITIERTASESIPSTGQEDAATRASGTLIVYNDYSSASQRLIRNTRFEAANGKIYRIDNSIVIPGKKGTTPGSVEAIVYADEPGESYNGEHTDFTIPGFKGAPQYGKFYARSKTPLTGGFVGKRLTIKEEVRTNTKAALDMKLKSELATAAAAQTPEGFEIFDGALFFDVTPIEDIESGSAITLGEKAIVHGLLFSTSGLAKEIALRTGSSPAEEADITLGEDSGLSFTIAEADNYRPWEKESFSFMLKGTAHLVSLFSAEALKQDLLGKSKSALQTVLTGYPGIERAEVVSRPFWKGSFPTEPDEIILTISLDGKN